MTESINCQWIENNLEALYSDKLDQEQVRLARAHIESCESCSREVQALNAIDPLVKNYFQRELQVARQRRTLRAGRVFGLSAATLALVAVLLFVVLGTPQTQVQTHVQKVQPSSPVTPSEVAPVAQNDDVTPPGKTPDESTPAARSKPLNQPKIAPDRTPPARPATSENAPELLVTDLAGYAHKLEDYRGHVVLVAVWSGASQEAISNLETLYKTYGGNVKFRFVGVSNARVSKPANATFPVFYNQGSKVFGAGSGEFVLLDQNGGVLSRGSLTKDIESLRETLRGI
jgi:hypothetical protein